jgi:hypothetical protein
MNQKPTQPCELSLHERNRILLNAVRDIFGFSKRRSWVDFKSQISGREIRELYTVQASLWTPQTNWLAVMPPPNGTLRALSDEIFVVDPFMNSWIIKQKYNPLENPDQYKSDAIKLVHFQFQLSSWIESGMVKLVPDPSGIDVGFKWETIELAKLRHDNMKLDKEDLDDAHAANRAEFMRVLCALPEDKLFAFVERSGIVLNEQEKKKFLKYARQKIRDDPIAWEQSIGQSPERGQLTAMRGGANLETALVISAVTGAFPYTNL